MSDLYFAQTDALVSSINPVSTLLTHLYTNWGASITPSKTAITFTDRFSNMSASFQIRIMRINLSGPPQVLGASRYRRTDTYRIDIVAKAVGETISSGVTTHTAITRKQAMENEVLRIIQTSRRALISSGFDEVEIDDAFEDIETGNDNQTNAGIAAEQTLIVRSKAQIRLHYDVYVV